MSMTIGITDGLSPQTAMSTGQAGSAITCFRCGVCCERYQVRLELTEVKRIAAYLRLPLPEFIDKYSDSRWPGRESLLLRHSDNACVFLRSAGQDKQSACLIHAVKPESCQEWTAHLSQPECREGLARHWQLTVSPSGRLSGPEEAQRRFNAFWSHFR